LRVTSIVISFLTCLLSLRDYLYDDDDESFLHFQWAKCGQYVFHILVHLQTFSLMIFVRVVTLCKYDV